jgi:SAM-dependent methyltransferase
MRALVFLTLPLLAIATLVSAQTDIPTFKDPANLGPDIPTPMAVVEGMLRAANVQAGETVYDLGCGDARILIRAVQEYSAKGVGIELSRDIAEKTTAHIKSMGLDDRIRIIHGSALDANLAPADVVTIYFLTSSNDRLKPILATLRPGARVVSHDYEIRGWKPVAVRKIPVMGMIHTVYLYRK